MPTVAALTESYGNLLLAPLPGSAVCEVCFDLTDGRQRCYRCARNNAWLDAVVPISYSVAHEQLHHVLAGYKRRDGRVAKRFQLELAAVLWRFLELHEGCAARAARTAGFELVTTIPSSSRERDAGHPLHRIVGEQVQPTRSRFERLLEPGEPPARAREFSLTRYRSARKLAGRSVLLIDDTWTTGASARSAAATLKQAGASTVAMVVIGRHLHREYGDNDRRLRGLAGPFDWHRCALEGRG
jgi:hypothetical protein